MRLQGHVARSAQVVGAVVLLGASAGLTVLGGMTALQLLDTLEQQLRLPATLESRPEQITEHTRNLLGAALSVVLLPFAALFLLATAANLAQIGLLFAPAAIKPQWSRLSPSRALHRTLSASNLAGSALTLLRAIAVMGIAGVLLWRELPELCGISRLGVQPLASYSGTCLSSFALKLSAALCVIAVFDYAVQHWRHARSLRMSRDEWREEQRDMEQDPLLHQRLRAARHCFGHRGPPQVDP